MIKVALPIMHGQKIILRPPKSADVEQRLSLGANREYHYQFADDTTIMLSKEELEKRWFEEAVAYPDETTRLKADQHVAQIEADEQWIGSATLNNIDTRHRRAEMTLGIYNREYQGAGYGTEATRLMLDYAFNHLKLHRAGINILLSNQRSIVAAKKVGFSFDGLSRDYFYLSGKWIDSVRLVILEDEFQRRYADSQTAR